MDKDKQQKFFQKTLWHMKKQNWEECMDASGEHCTYWNQKEGTKCAIGHHIPEDDYREGMEDLEVAHLLQEYPHLEYIFKDIPLPLMQDLQSFHDGMMRKYVEPDQRQKEADSIAQRHGLIQYAPTRGFYCRTRKVVSDE
jgi:hypothetical protein